MLATGYKLKVDLVEVHPKRSFPPSHPHEEPASPDAKVSTLHTEIRISLSKVVSQRHAGSSPRTHGPTTHSPGFGRGMDPPRMCPSDLFNPLSRIHPLIGNRQMRDSVSLPPFLSLQLDHHPAGTTTSKDRPPPTNSVTNL